MCKGRRTSYVRHLGGKAVRRGNGEKDGLNRGEKEDADGGHTTLGSMRRMAAAAAWTLFAFSMQSSNVYKFCRAGFEKLTFPLSTILNLSTPHP